MLILTKATADKIIKDMSESLQNNKEFIKAFKKFSDESESDIQKRVKDMKVSDSFKTTNIIIYTTGITDNVVKFSVKSDEASIEVQVEDDDNNLILSLESNGVSLKIDYRFDVNIMKK